MRTNINLDDGLVEEAFRYANVRTKKELVHLALQEFVANHRPMDVRELWGKDGLLPDFDYKRLRNLPLEERPLSAEQEAALERLLDMNHHLGGIAPSRDELQER